MEIIKLIQSISSPFFDWFFQTVTMLGEAPFFILSMALILWCVDVEFGYRLGLVLLTSNLLNTGIKETLRIKRPIGMPGIRSIRLETAGGYSFPSGHTQSATTFWLSVILKLRKKRIWILGGLLILSVGISRLYLGVHYPTDVIGGIVIGVIWVLVANGIFDYALRTGKNRVFLLIIIPMCLGFFFVTDAFYYKISGAVMAIILGYIIERKYIHYEVRAGIGLQVCKAVLGLAGLFLLSIFLKRILPEAPIYDLARYFMMGFWVTVLAPLLFKKVFKASEKKGM